jgi:hypothetical protein
MSATGRLVKIGKAVPDYPGKDALAEALRPVLGPLARNMANGMLQRLLGFWVVWHTYGGVHEIVAAGLMARGTVYRQRNEFLEVFGVNVEDFMPATAAAMAVESKAPAPAAMRRKAGA